MSKVVHSKVAKLKINYGIKSIIKPHFLIRHRNHQKLVPHGKRPSETINSSKNKGTQNNGGYMEYKKNNLRFQYPNLF